MNQLPEYRAENKPFRLQSDFTPAGDQPEAIAALLEGLEDGLAHQTLLGVTGSGKTFTMARVIDRHPFRNEYRHIDFVTVSRDETVVADVAIEFVGTPVGVREGGVFSPRRTTVQIEVLITDIPSSIELDVEEVEIGGSLRIEDLPELDGVTYVEEPEAVIMSVTVPAAEIEEEPELDEEELELLEGEEAPEGEEAEEGAEGEEEAEGDEAD